MALTKSSMLPLGTTAPDFILHDVMTGRRWTLTDIIQDKPFLIIFMCNHCPYVKHVEEEIARVAKTYVDRVAIAAISSNDVASYPDDSPDNLKAQGERLGFNFPYFYDDRQDTAKDYKATCTPDFYLFDKDKKLVYRGQLDDSRPGNGYPTNGKDLREAIETLLSGGAINQDQKPSMGCSIKWKPGNEPDYIEEPK